MKAFTRALAGITCGLAIVLGIFSLAWTFALEGTPLEDAIGVGLTNAALDASGVKGRMEDALRSSTGAIAEATGMSEDQVSAAIDQLDISSWSAMALPTRPPPAPSRRATRARRRPSPRTPTRPT